MDNPEDQNNSPETEPVDKLKLTASEQKFYGANPQLLTNAMTSLDGRDGRLKVLQDRNKFLNDRLSTIERTIKAYNGLYNNDPTKIPPALTEQLQQLTGELQKTGAAYEQEFNNVKPLPPDPTTPTFTIPHNGKDIPVNQDVYSKIRNGDPNMMQQLAKMQSDPDPQVREKASAMAHAVGFDISTGEHGEMLASNQGIGDQPNTPVPPQVQNPNAVQGQSPSQAGQSAVKTISNSLSTGGVAGGASGAVEMIRRSLISNLAKDRK